MDQRHSLLVLCANLPRRKDRRFVIEQHLPEVLGEPVNFFPAVDGEAVPHWKPKRRHPEATGSGYAVRLTKRRALRSFLRSGKNFLLYVEDDVAVAEDFDRTVEDAMERKYDMVFLGGGHHIPPVGEGRWRKCRRTYNNHALLFSREGANRCLKVLAGWKNAWSDTEIQLATADGRLEAWCPDEWVAFQRETKSDNWGNSNFVRIAEVAQPMLLPDDLAVLDAAEAAFKIELSNLAAGSDPTAWALLQVNLARLYEARADITGRDRGERASASMALEAALDVFAEQGLRSLSMVAADALERLNGSSRTVS